VVRLNYVDGAVSRQPPGLDEWVPAAVNLPLGTGDNLWVAPGARAELHAGATGLRLAQGTGLEVLRLEDRSLQLGLPRGSVELRILTGREADSVEVDTPAGAVLLERPGDYRVDVDADDGASRVTVRSGQAAVMAAGVTVPVDPGAALELSGGGNPSYDVVEARAPDGFDQWCAGREQRENGSESAQYVGRSLTGYEDLDGRGDWRINKTFGTVWVPRVPAGWAPYREGRWIWSEPWGWTWLDDAPWGFAPAHYGRWAYVDQTWMWQPYADGMRLAEPVYAPALVAFVGGPAPSGAGSEGGGVAWFPLGPQEPYVPAYPASRSYVQSLNAGSLPPGAVPARLQGAAHANQGVPGGVTMVPRSVFLGARSVAAAALPGPTRGRGLRVGSAPALTPRRESVLAGAPAGERPPAAVARPLMVRDRMPLAPVPFEARQQALAVTRGRPLGASAFNGLRPRGTGLPARLATSSGPGGGLRPLRPLRPLVSQQAASAPDRPIGPMYVMPSEPPPTQAMEPKQPLRPGPGRVPGQLRNPAEARPAQARPNRPAGPKPSKDLRQNPPRKAAPGKPQGRRRVQ